MEVSNTMKINKEYYKLRNYRCISVKYLGPTNHLGSRVKLTCENTSENMAGCKESRVFSYDHVYSNIGEQAFKLLIKNGWKPICKVCLWDRDLILCDNWADEYLHLKDLKDD